MELTIDQALQQGVVAHKEGKLQEAEELYRAILQSQPKHPDANHNLGVIAVAVNKAEAALPLFKTADKPLISAYLIGTLSLIQYFPPLCLPPPTGIAYHHPSSSRRAL